MKYDHTQRGPLGLLMAVIGLGLGAGAVALWGDPAATILLLASALFFWIGLLASTLSVRDEVDRLTLRFGPVPLFHWTVPYERIASVEPGRSRIIDGWGMHWLPSRGWTINLWGFDCVELKLTSGRRIRIGTDDQATLVEFLREKTLAPAA